MCHIGFTVRIGDSVMTVMSLKSEILPQVLLIVAGNPVRKMTRISFYYYVK